MEGMGVNLQRQLSESKQIRLHRYQSMALQLQNRFVALIAGTGGGKTYAGPMWLYREIDKHPKDNFWVVAPTYRMLSRATVPTLVEIFRGTTYQGELLLSQGQYRLPTGGMIWLGSADRPEGLEGGQARAAWLDEAGQMKRHVWIVMQARLGMLQGRVFITTTPYAVNWLYSDFYKLWVDGDPDYGVVQFPSTENPYYPVAEFERAQRSMSPELFEMRYCGQFRKMEGLIYPGWNADNICDPFDIPEDWRRLGGVDHGYNNPNVILKAAMSPDDVIYIYEEHYERNRLLSHHAENMKDGLRYVADPSGKREIVEYRYKGIDVIPGNNDVGLGINAMNERINTNRLKAFKGCCPNFCEEIEMYAWEEPTERSQERRDKPMKVDDHAMDAGRYMVMEFDRSRTVGDGLVRRIV